MRSLHSRISAFQAVTRRIAPVPFRMDPEAIPGIPAVKKIRSNLSRYLQTLQEK
jgi:hypothetical protein